MCFLPLLGTSFCIPLCIIGFILTTVSLKRIIAFYIVDRKEEMLLKVKKVEITLNNCETFLNKHLNDLEKTKEKTKDLTDIELADKIIREYIESDDFDCYIDDNISDLIVKILQSDLHSTENDVNLLLEQAKGNLIDAQNDIKKKQLNNKEYYYEYK